MDGMSSGHFIEALISKCWLFPAISIAFLVLIRLQTRRDVFSKRELFAFGSDAMVTAILTFLALTNERALDLLRTAQSLSNLVDPALRAASEAHSATLESNLVWAGAEMFAIFFLLIVLTSLVRFWGTTEDGELRVVVGIVIPDIVGFFALMVVACYFSN